VRFDAWKRLEANKNSLDVASQRVNRLALRRIEAFICRAGWRKLFACFTAFTGIV
jgi:hypothetical protein